MPRKPGNKGNGLWDLTSRGLLSFFVALKEGCMADKVLSINQQDEIGLRVNFLKEVFHILNEATPLKNLTLGDFETMLLVAGRKLMEVKDILSGKDIVRQDAEVMVGIS